jgi:hypothetical protein
VIVVSDKKIMILSLVAALLIILLFPIPFENFEAGGSNGMLKSVVYTVYDWQYKSSIGIDGEAGYIQGRQVYVFGRLVFDNTVFTPID